MIEAKKENLSTRGTLKSSTEGAEEKNLIIEATRAIMERYANNAIKTGSRLDQSECIELVNRDIEAEIQLCREKVCKIIKAPVNSFLVPYMRFISERTKEFNLTFVTGKMYTNLLSALQSFSEYKKTPLTFEYMSNKATIIDLKSYMSFNLNYSDNTTARRLASLRTYLNWLEDNDYYSFDRKIYRVRQNRYQKEIIALSREELQQLINIKTDNEAYQRIIDVFVCNCFLGLRVSDLMTLDRGEFKQDEEGDYFYIKENIKTGITVNIPITAIPLAILKKYNFALPQYASQYFNRELHKILKEYKLFEYPVVHIRKVQKESRNSTVLKREVITSHTCRKTFITLSVSNNIPLNVIMKASGHRQINTLNSYIQAVSNKNEFKKLCS
jgi:integrase